MRRKEAQFGEEIEIKMARFRFLIGPKVTVASVPISGFVRRYTIWSRG